jgi:hypothetical protein
VSVPPPQVEWTTEEAPSPRYAYHSADEPYPGLPRATWWRLVCLMRHRGHLADGPAMRMARHLAATLDHTGTAADVPRLVETYAAHHRVSARTAWADLARLTSRGLVRQLQAAAPGFPARYRLCAPVAVVATMGGLPAELASWVQLHTSPSLRDGLPTVPRARARTDHPEVASQDRRGLSRAEANHAAELVSQCSIAWARQDRSLTEAERARLVSLVAIALRHVPPGEAFEILTSQVRSARDLSGLLAYRLGRVITAARKSHRLADDAGARYARMLAERANRSGPGAEARAAIERARKLLAVT